jgi:cytochrome c-type biogenesis protein CcmE
MMQAGTSGKEDSMATATAGHPGSLAPRSGDRTKFLVGGLLIVGAVVYLIATTLQSTAQFFYTVDEIQAKGDTIVGKNLRASGAVLGDTIQYDPSTLTIRFVVVNVSNDNDVIEAQGGLAEVLHNAVNNPNAARMTVQYVGVKPDLLKDEAQAIVTGKLGADGVFYADELLLKCPTRYEEALPTQAVAGS